MKTRTLFSAFAAAQTLAAGAPAAAPGSPTVVTDDTTLLNALRNRATDRDQIIQRRICLLAVGADADR
jgi:uncharacterized membrane protein YgcG